MITDKEDENRKCNYTRMCISSDCTSLANTFYRTSSNVTSQYTKSNRYTNTWGQAVFNSPISNYDAKQFIEKFVGGIAEDEYVDENNLVTDPSGETTISFWIYMSAIFCPHSTIFTALNIEQTFSSYLFLEKVRHTRKKQLLPLRKRSC